MRYLNTDIEAEDGDIVHVLHGGGRKSECNIVKVIFPNTEDAQSWFAPNGGVLVEDTNHGLCVWNYLDEDIEFVRRKNDKKH